METTGIINAGKNDWAGYGFVVAKTQYSNPDNEGGRETEKPTNPEGPGTSKVDIDPDATEKKPTPDKTVPVQKPDQSGNK
ncbi:MAG TPA: hypothetical protein VI731_07620 [Bacteroidia bacterium]|nr:hypothetical protein [Bacteroidia bacterium]